MRKLATGMIYLGEEAASNGLVDEVGGLRQAEDKARSLAGVGPEVPLNEYGGGSFLEELFKMQSSSGLSGEIARVIAEDPLTLLSRGLFLNTAARDLVIR